MASTVGNYFIAVVYNSLYSSISKETLAFLKQMLGIKVSVKVRNGVKQDAVDCSQLPHICHLKILFNSLCAIIFYFTKFLCNDYK